MIQGNAQQTDLGSWQVILAIVLCVALHAAGLRYELILSFLLGAGLVLWRTTWSLPPSLLAAAAALLALLITSQLWSLLQV